MSGRLQAWRCGDRLHRMFACPVCEHVGLDVKPYEIWPPPEGVDLRPPYWIQLGEPSYEVCVRCGFEFGNDDDPGTVPVGDSFESYRIAWQARGRPWLSPRYEHEAESAAHEGNGAPTWASSASATPDAPDPTAVRARFDALARSRRIGTFVIRVGDRLRDTHAEVRETDAALYTVAAIRHGDHERVEVLLECADPPTRLWRTLLWAQLVTAPDGVVEIHHHPDEVR
jgi:hypothetical protein